jgi:hypothetical protein
VTKEEMDRFPESKLMLQISAIDEQANQYPTYLVLANNSNEPS